MDWKSHYIVAKETYYVVKETCYCSKIDPLQRHTCDLEKPMQQVPVESKEGLLPQIPPLTSARSLQAVHQCCVARDSDRKL